MTTWASPSRTCIRVAATRTCRTSWSGCEAPRGRCRPHADHRGLGKPGRAPARPRQRQHGARLLVRRGQQPRRLRALGLQRDDEPTRVQDRLAEAIRAPLRRRADHRRPGPARLDDDHEERSWRVKLEGPDPGRCDQAPDKRTNIPTADAHDFIDPEIEEVRKVRYARDESLDPQLMWRGKYPPRRRARRPRQRPLTDAPPIYIQEKIDPRVLIENLRRTAQARRGT